MPGFVTKPVCAVVWHTLQADAGVPGDYKSAIVFFKQAITAAALSANQGPRRY